MAKTIKESLESGLPFEINMNNNKTEVPYEIEKKWSTGTTIVIDKIGDQTFGFPKDKVQSWSWELLKDTATINGYFCNKAQKKIDTVITTVWYCNSIPYPDGPLTNFGLAGLIIKSESNNGWSAEITSLQQFTQPHLFLQTPKYVLVSEVEFIKAKKAMKEKSISNKEFTNDDGTIKVIKQ
jgi:GLPGLI family protein